MAKVPDNLLRLHAHEGELFARSVDAVARTDGSADHLTIVEAAMDVLDKLRQMPNESEDEKAIAVLGIRVFNDFASAWKLVAGGYYQVGAMVARDILETIWLVNWFYLEPSLVEQWRMADEAGRFKKFRPSLVRKALDRHAGQGKSKREDIYKKFCNLAAHPTMEGFAMLRPLGMDIKSGPFFDVTALKAMLEEIGMLGPQAGFAFATHLEGQGAGANAVVHKFLRTAMLYSTKYLGITYTQADIDALDELYGRAV